MSDNNESKSGVIDIRGMLANNEARQVQAGEVTPTVVTVELEPTLESVYANHMLLVAMPHEFVLDFFHAEPLGRHTDGRAKHVSRVTIPITLLPGILRAIKANVSPELQSYAEAVTSRNAQQPEDSE